MFIENSYFLSLLFLGNISAIIDVFKFKNVNNVVLWHCLDLKYVISVQNQFRNNGIRSNCFSIDPNVSYEIPNEYSKVGILLNTSCESWERMIASNVPKLRNNFVWILIAQDVSNTVNALSKYRIEIDSDVTIISKGGKNYYLHEIYNTGFFNQGLFVVRNVGFWNTSLHIDKNINRMDFRGLELKCGIVLMEDVEDKMCEHYLTVTSRNKVDPLHRFKYFKLLSHLQDLLNFRCYLVRTKSWGYQHNTSFDGLVGMLQRREVDIGGAPVFYRSERARVLDYTAQIWPSKPYFILRQPKYAGAFYTIYTRPLTKNVWYCIFGVLTVAGIILGALLKLKVLHAKGDEQDTSLTLAVLFVFSAVSQQGMLVNKNSISVKVVIFVTFIFTLTLYQYYNATVVSTLLRVPPKVIDSLKDLVKSDFGAGVDDALYNRDFFKHTIDPLAIELHRKKIVTSSHNNYFRPEHGLRLVKQGGFAFLVDSATAYRIMRKTFCEKEICDATEISLYPQQSMGSVAIKGTPYKEFLALGTSKMLESGVMHRLKSMWDAPRPQCVRTPDASIFSVTIYEFSMALVVLLLGMLAAVLVLVCEITAHRLDQVINQLPSRNKRVIEFRH